MEKMHKEFIVGQLFDIHPTATYKMTNNALYETSGIVPVLSNSSANNGIGGYVGLEPTEKGGIITFSDTTTGADTIFYQPKDFIGYSHVQGMYPYDEQHWTERCCLYFIASLQKAAGNSWDYANKFNRKLVGALKVQLPVQTDCNNQPIIDDNHIYHDNGFIPDWDFMDTYIRAFEESCIRDLKAQQIRELKAYLAVTGLENLSEQFGLNR